MNARPYVFYKYLLEDDGETLGPSEEWECYKSLKGAWQPHRKPNPKENDYDTALVELRKTTSDDSKPGAYEIVFFSIIQKLTSRPSLEYNQNEDKLQPVEVPAEDIRRGFIIMVPSKKLMAVQDSSTNEDINAQGTNARLKSVIKALNRCHFRSELLASSADIKKAMEVWSIERFHFEAWPFNPHPRRGGEKLESLLSRESVRINSVVKSNKGEKLVAQEGGIINQAMALGEHGYASYGGRGKTVDGFKAFISKAIPGGDKTVKLKIYIPVMPIAEDHVRAVAKAMLEIHDG